MFGPLLSVRLTESHKTVKDLKSEMRIQTDFDHIVEQKGVQITLCIVVSDFFAKENLTHVDL